METKIRTLSPLNRVIKENYLVQSNYTFKVNHETYSEVVTVPLKNKLEVYQWDKSEPQNENDHRPIDLHLAVADNDFSYQASYLELQQFDDYLDSLQVVDESVLLDGAKDFHIKVGVETTRTTYKIKDTNLIKFTYEDANGGIIRLLFASSPSDQFLLDFTQYKLNMSNLYAILDLMANGLFGYFQGFNFRLKDNSSLEKSYSVMLNSRETLRRLVFKPQKDNFIMLTTDRTTLSIRMADIENIAFTLPSLETGLDSVYLGLEVKGKGYIYLWLGY